MRDINLLFGQALNQTIEASGIQKKNLLAETGLARNTLFGCLSGKKGTQIDKIDAVLLAVGVDILSLFSEKPPQPADPADFVDIPNLGRARAGTYNGTIDICISDHDFENWEGPFMSVARDRLKRGMRGVSIRKGNIVSFEIVGDSMLPLFQEGDFVFIVRTGEWSEIKHGDIIAASLDGEGLLTIKLFDKIGVLRPVNPSFPLIRLSDYEKPKLFGRVFALERSF